MTDVLFLFFLRLLRLQLIDGSYEVIHAYIVFGLVILALLRGDTQVAV